MTTGTIIGQAMTDFRLVELLTLRLILTAELRGSIRIGDSRSREVIMDELRRVEAELRSR